MIEPWHFHAPSKLTVVQTAAKHNELAIMQALLAHGFLDHETNGEGETALHLAAHNGSLDVAKVLCRHAMESKCKSIGVRVCYVIPSFLIAVEITIWPWNYLYTTSI